MVTSFFGIFVTVFNNINNKNVNMRKLLLFFVALLTLATATAQTVVSNQTAVKAKSMIPDHIDPLNVQRQFDISLTRDLVPQGVKTQKVAKSKRFQLKRADASTVDTTSFFAVAQSYYKSYTFTYTGGDVKTYNIGVAVDGTKVTFSKLFNLYDPTSWSVSSDSDVVGTYDATAKTITIPTSTVFANATIAGKIYNYYPGVLLSGTVDEEGNLTPADNLVFHVEGDFDRIYTDQSFGISEYTADGSSSYGFYKMYRSFSAYLPKSSPNLMTFTDNVDYGELFPGDSLTKSVTIVNTGGSSADAVVSVESDDESFYTDSLSITVPAQSTLDVPITFKASEIGDHDGIATIEYDNGDPISFTLSGKIISQPDFSPIVKHGTFSFETNIDAPWALDTLSTGEVVAASTTGGKAGSSKLTATFTVPDGQIGKLSWKGMSNNSNYWYYAAGGYFVDDMNTSVAAYEYANTDISNSIELAPGEHKVRFQYDQYYYSGLDADRMYIYDLDLETETLNADSAILNTSELDLGNAVLQDGGTATKAGTITLTNVGSNSLSVKDITTDNSEITADKNVEAAATLKELSIPVTLSTKTAGDKTANLTITTSAGTFKVKVTAKVVAMPDFSSIVTEAGVPITWTTDADNPFVIENDTAYNLSSGEPDYTSRTSTFTGTFTIPSGKLGYLSWDGYLYGTPDSVTNYWAKDYANIEIGHPMMTGVHSVWGQCDAGSASVFGSDDYWADYLACTPGDHHIKFQYVQNGDTIYYGKDRLEISNIKLHVIDYKEHNAELLTPSAAFDSTYVGDNRYTTTTVELHNLGSNYLRVDSINHVGPFYGVVPTDSAAFNKTLDVTLWFFPSEEGDYSDSLTIYTNAGAFKVACAGKTKDASGILLIGDFEDEAQGWGTYDDDNDGETWNLGYNLWGDNPNYVHSGHECLASVSYSNSLGSITPDNWTISPSFDVPADGAVLTYYVAGFHPDRYAEHYSMYVTAKAAQGISAILTDTATEEETIATPVYEESNGYVNGWELHTVDLKPWAGQTVNLAFRHYDCTGQYILRLDDVFVRTNARYTADGIQGLTSDSQHGGIKRQEFYTVAGERISTPAKGVNIVRTYYSDGTMKSFKYIKVQ